MGLLLCQDDDLFLSHVQIVSSWIVADQQRGEAVVGQIGQDGATDLFFLA
jgi:hypothetical protein